MGRKKKSVSSIDRYSKTDAIFSKPETTPQKTEEAAPVLDKDRAALVVEEHNDPEGKTRKSYKKRVEELEAEKQARISSESTNRFIASTLTSLAGMLCDRMPVPKSLSESEKDEFNKLSQALVDKYMSGFNWQLEISFVLCVGYIFGSRMKPKETKEVVEA